MTTVLNGKTFDVINDIIGNFCEYNDLDKYQICVYNEDKENIRLTINRKEDNALLLNALVKDD